MIAPKNKELVKNREMQNEYQELSSRQLWGIAEMAEEAIKNWVAREIEGTENQERESIRVMKLLVECNTLEPVVLRAIL